MTDEELALVLRDAYDNAKPMTWINGEDDAVPERYMPRVHARWLATVRAVRHDLESSQREQTAATILAAMWANEPEPIGRTPLLVKRAVELADALRAELARKP